MKKELTQEFIMDYWLFKFHNTTCEEVVKKHPKLCKTYKWYEKYACTQEQHDEWYDWAIRYMAKYYGWSLKRTKERFVWDYLNCAPTVKNISYKMSK